MPNSNVTNINLPHSNASQSDAPLDKLQIDIAPSSTMLPDNAPADNVIQFNSFKKTSQQELIDDIGARAFLFIRDAAEQMGIPVKDVIVEHMLGLALVMAAVEGKSATRAVLNNIRSQLTDT